MLNNPLYKQALRDVLNDKSIGEQVQTVTIDQLQMILKSSDLSPQFYINLKNCLLTELLERQQQKIFDSLVEVLKVWQEGYPEYIIEKYFDDEKIVLELQPVTKEKTVG